ncbi:hypothetical protein [Methylobacterium planeticum]|uniref:Uncharacterized protein n=1 Tax=Methylobacterium planeticum TaxID=2615211 RepID=A0A6N6MGN9_9HYPH|nr:hypothetical protein [Methylobacterium planeticum]KAB1068553.1 hypothetical protein F6X51_26695 [Methylobacterium planeticum]
MTTRTVKPIQSSVGLPAERLAQLRALADRHGVSAVEIVERVIRSAVEAGEIEDTLPGFAEVAVADDDVLFVSIREASLPLLNRDQAHLIAAVIDAATGTTPLLNLEFKSGTAMGIPLGYGHKLYVGRHAKAVTFTIVDGKTGETTLRTATTASIATDFARLLRKNAAELVRPVFQLTDDGSAVPTVFFRRLVSDETTAPNATAIGETR